MPGSIIVASPERNHQEYLDYLNYLIAHASLFTSSEFRVAAVCLYHTLRLNKRSASLSLRFLTGGVAEAHGGTGLGRKAVVEALRGLESKEFIHIHRQTGASGRNLPNIIEILDVGGQPVDAGGIS